MIYILLTCSILTALALGWTVRGDYEHAQRRKRRRMKYRALSTIDAQAHRARLFIGMN